MDKTGKRKPRVLPVFRKTYTTTVRFSPWVKMVLEEEMGDDRDGMAAIASWVMEAGLIALRETGKLRKDSADIVDRAKNLREAVSDIRKRNLPSELSSREISIVAADYFPGVEQ